MVRSIINLLFQKLKQNFLLVLILVIATVLRLYHWTEIPYMHDELSALLRTEFDNFSDLINLGVKYRDTHPALIQVFLYYWTGIFGYSAWIVKLPFILSGIGSVYLAYRLGLRLSSKTTGLIIASIIACSEYTLMFSQIIRPYSSGLFFTLLLVYHWSELVFYKNYRLKHQFYFVLATILCAYNHHFSLFASGLTGFAGLFFIERKFLWKYLLLCAIVVLAYLPHLHIFLKQLGDGGVGAWLGKPEPDFLLQFLFYVCHFSLVLVIFLVIIWCFGRISGHKTPRQRLPLYFSGGLFFTVYFTAYFYSIYSSSVLQYSVLIFVFPFLLLFIFGWIKEQSSVVNTILVACICIGFTSTLIFGRKYYSIFYVPIFKQLIVDAHDAVNEEPKTLTILYTDEPKTRFYERYQGLIIPKSWLFINEPTFTEKELTALLNEKSGQYERIYLGAICQIPPNFRAIILSCYSHILWQRNYFSASSLLVSKGIPSEKPIADLVKTPKLFNGYDPSKWYNQAYHFRQNEEWGPGFSKPLSELIRKPSDVIDVIVKLKLSDFEHNPLLIIAAQSNDSIIQFKGTEAKFNLLNRSDSTVTLIQSMRFIDLKYKHFDKPFLSTYIWNRDQKPLQILSFRVIYRTDNPVVYALNEDFEAP
ncbi:hypothetical protein [Fluviicola sp.]|jgi:hypothetical protein|uniref:glycosyltransferase family 39 protein n=1 Tax=Fluviicola sp. TaxID=1917219 RepID=UPI002826B78E|nr:hypothetical protein [Fluviicola sp.]MDR0803454.1 hypothetical protein [Fluviicola sp.]